MWTVLFTGLTVLMFVRSVSTLGLTFWERWRLPTNRGRRSYVLEPIWRRGVYVTVGGFLLLFYGLITSVIQKQQIVGVMVAAILVFGLTTNFLGRTRNS